MAKTPEKPEPKAQEKDSMKSLSENDKGGFPVPKRPKPTQEKTPPAKSR